PGRIAVFEPHLSETPSTKLQNPEKLQAPSSKRGPRFGAWNLGFLWCLALGVWCLGPGASLELGAWNLELFAWALSFSKIEMCLCSLDLCATNSFASLLTNTKASG